MPSKSAKQARLLHSKWLAQERERRRGPRKKQYMAQWFKKNARRRAQYYADYRHKIRLEMVAAYGGCCAKCGEDDEIVLVLDHKRNDGAADKRAGVEGGFKLYQALKRAGWPRARHQLLCHNCNFRKEYLRRKNAVKIR